MALAILVRAVELSTWATVLVVDFAFMAKQATAVCEAWKLLAAGSRALVRAVVFVHVLSVVSLCYSQVRLIICTNNIAGKGTLTTTRTSC